MNTRIATIVAAAAMTAGMIAAAPPAHADDAPVVMAVQGQLEVRYIMPSQRGLNIKFIGLPTPEGMVEGVRIKWVIKTDGRLWAKGTLGAGDLDLTRVVFPRHTGSHLVEITANTTDAPFYYKVRIKTGHRR